MIATTSFLMNKNVVKIEQVNWQDAEAELRDIRTTVFIEEQSVPEELEWDEYDESGVHVLAKIENKAIATGRLLHTGQVGRMAVLKLYRKQGVGSKIIKEILSIADKMQMNIVFLHSQVDAIAFYQKFGFEEEGGVFDDAGIPHKKMIMRN